MFVYGIYDSTENRWDVCPIAFGKYQCYEIFGDKHYYKNRQIFMRIPCEINVEGFTIKIDKCLFTDFVVMYKIGGFYVWYRYESINVANKVRW